MMAEQRLGQGPDKTAGRPESSQVTKLADLSVPETLRAAARLLREVAAQTLVYGPLPWGAGRDPAAVRPWWLMMSPALADPLAALLLTIEAHAEAMEGDCSLCRPAVALAGAILGGQHD